jgi:hypothetical protein
MIHVDWGVVVWAAFGIANMAGLVAWFYCRDRR